MGIDVVSDMTIEEYEQFCEEQRKRNEGFLADFESDLKAKGFTRKTIENHLFNADLYLNDYLVRAEGKTAEEGVNEIGLFMSYFFIHKCMWSTPSTIKSTAASIKKFYKSMVNHNHLSEEAYKSLCEIIKEELPDWQKECEAYNNGEDLLDLWDDEE